ncbi:MULTISPECIES: hypothetical protein [Pseudomonas]|uniref:Uncharacterized protein n=1 Tax=Pseudomonas fortuita TaxID=3233375 RepID=A0ACD4PC59_9PSED|nr:MULTISPECIES: hypothetical protein [Pseudomonas]ERT19786.2 hypothetical protein O162_03700 [Pseudomonas putida SJ3]MBP2084313.1 hypothetical protein [Pseudomonas sp. PvP089]MBP2089986.1 hypothetical protein [Pseudomonas sp. PvP088]MCE0782299.1 hypothetical protein [Pseudomonas sp. NMI542_15]MCE0965239.1 hypothetical protein [Pseudomonas sp. NMI4491_12]PNB57375.1 hypothetical protein C1X73_16770 [Pseudomonas sp. FW305-130]PTC01295.1 hypothetical protein C9975_02930 [Thalassospira xiamenens
MRKLSSRWKKVIGFTSLLSVFIFAGLISNYLISVYRDSPRAPCSASIDFVHVEEGEGLWRGVGDMTIDPNEGAIYAYYHVISPRGVKYVYDRRFELSLTHLDTSRYLFKTRSISTFDGDTAGSHIPFMARGFQGGIMTFNAFSDFEYYFNVNNLVVGVCHVPR